MIVRKNMGRVKLLLMVLMVMGFSFATYNLVSMIIDHNKEGGLESFDHGRVVMGSTNSKFHVTVTATDAAYSQWQCRIVYYWYKKVKDMPGSDMGKFTRILHSGRADQLMDEIPSFVVDPLPEGLDRVNIFFFCFYFYLLKMFIYFW